MERRRGKARGGDGGGGRYTFTLRAQPGGWTHHVFSQAIGLNEVTWPCLTAKGGRDIQIVP